VQALPRTRPPSWVLGVVFLALAGSYLVATPDPTFDLKADRLTALAALDGADPYAPLSELTVTYESDLGWTHVHPRTPGALVLQVPLAALPESWLRAVSVVVTAAAVVATTVVALRLRPVGPVVAALVIVLIGVSSIAVEAVSVGAQSSVVALLLAVAWWRTREGDDMLAGVAVGVAITLKLFPWLLLVLLVFRRRITALWVVVTAAVLNGLGLLFPGVALSGALDALSAANLSESAELNGSLIRMLSEWIPAGPLTVGLALVGGLLAVVIGRASWGMDRQWFAVLAVSLAASPLIWRHYALVLIPALVWLAVRGGRTGKWVVAFAGLLLLLPYPLVTVWLVLPTCAAVAVAAAVTQRRPDVLQQPSNR
jgi:hypothetical protein